jgi:hypothetical protein
VNNYNYIVIETGASFIETLYIIYAIPKIRGSAGVLSTGYGLDDRGIGVRVPIGSRILSSPYRPDRLWGPSNLKSNGYRGLFPGSKRQGREGYRSPPTGAEVKITWIRTSALPYVFELN